MKLSNKNLRENTNERKINVNKNREFGKKQQRIDSRSQGIESDVGEISSTEIKQQLDDRRFGRNDRGYPDHNISDTGDIRKVKPINNILDVNFTRDELSIRLFNSKMTTGKSTSLKTRLMDNLKSMKQKLENFIKPLSQTALKLNEDRMYIKYTPEFGLAERICKQYPFVKEVKPQYYKERLQEVSSMERKFGVNVGSLDLLSTINGKEVGAPEMVSNSKNMFNTYRSALVVVARTKLFEAVNFFKNEKELYKSAFYDHVKTLFNATKLLKRYIPQIKPFDNLVESNMRRQQGFHVPNYYDDLRQERELFKIRNGLKMDKQEKQMRNMLDVLAKNWPNYMDDMFSASVALPERRRIALAIMMNTGLRNQEFMNGVEISKSNGKLEIKINSAKYEDVQSSDPNIKRYNKGQEYRILTFERNHPSVEFLYKIAPLTFKLNSVKELDFVKPFSQKILELKNKATNFLDSYNLKKTFVTPYVFRHAISARLKNELSSEDVSVAMGHNSLQMKLKYGQKTQAGGAGKGGTVMKVQGSREIKKPVSKRAMKQNNIKMG